MSDAIRTEDLDSADADLPVLDELLAPIARPHRAGTPRTARDGNDAFDRAFSALEAALRERDEVLTRPIRAEAPTPLAFTMPGRAPEAAPAPKVVEPATMPTGAFTAPSSSFVQPAFERVEANAPIITPAMQFERVDAILAEMRAAAREVMAQVEQQVEAAMPAPTAAVVEETIVFADAAPETEATPQQTAPADELDLMPFGMASLRMMVM